MTNCISGIGAVNGSGYCHTWRNGKRIGAHRNAYIEVNGEIPKGMHVMHICDNPKCINPNHLKLGTRSDNMKDCVSKGRHVSPMRKLTDEHRKCILKSKKTSTELAKELPVTARTIRRYRRANGQKSLMVGQTAIAVPMRLEDYSKKSKY